MYFIIITIFFYCVGRPFVLLITLVYIYASRVYRVSVMPVFCSGIILLHARSYFIIVTVPRHNTIDCHAAGKKTENLGNLSKIYYTKCINSRIVYVCTTVWDRTAGVIFSFARFNRISCRLSAESFLPCTPFITVRTDVYLQCIGDDIIINI